MPIHQQCSDGTTVVYILRDKLQHTVYPKRYAHGFVVLCFVVVIQSFIMNSNKLFQKFATVTIFSTESSLRTNVIPRSSNKKHPLFYLRTTSFSDYLVSHCKWTSPDKISHNAKNFLVDKTIRQNMSRSREICWIRATQSLNGTLF